MARGKRLTIGSRAVAVAVVKEALDEACKKAGAVDKSDIYTWSPQIAEELVNLAWDVEYKPTVERLVLTISAGIESPDRMRSTPEDQSAYEATAPE